MVVYFSSVSIKCVYIVDHLERAVPMLIFSLCPHQRSIIRLKHLVLQKSQTVLAQTN